MDYKDDRSLHCYAPSMDTLDQQNVKYHSFNSSVFQVLPISLNIHILWSLEGLCNLD